MSHPLTKCHWLDRALEIRKFHIQQLRTEPGWTIAKSAKTLNRSVGSISQDLLIASWSKTHEKQLRRCSSMRDALAYVRDKERQMKLSES